MGGRRWSRSLACRPARRPRTGTDIPRSAAFPGFGALHGDFGDHAQPTLGAQDHLADARAGRGVGEWPYDEHLAWHDSPEASGDVSDMAVLVRLHARGPGCHPAAERAVGEAVREVTESPAVLAQLPLDVWTQRSSLDRRQPGVVIDLEHTIEPAQINRDHRPGLIRRRFEAAGDVAATAERDQHGV